MDSKTIIKYSNKKRLIVYAFIMLMILLNLFFLPRTFDESNYININNPVKDYSNSIITPVAADKEAIVQESTINNQEVIEPIPLNEDSNENKDNNENKDSNENKDNNENKSDLSDENKTQNKEETQNIVPPVEENENQQEKAVVNEQNNDDSQKSTEIKDNEKQTENGKEAVIDTPITENKLNDEDISDLNVVIPSVVKPDESINNTEEKNVNEEIKPIINEKEEILQIEMEKRRFYRRFENICLIGFFGLIIFIIYSNNSHNNINKERQVKIESHPKTENIDDDGGYYLIDEIDKVYDI